MADWTLWAPHYSECVIRPWLRGTLQGEGGFSSWFRSYSCCRICQWRGHSVVLCPSCMPRGRGCLVTFESWPSRGPSDVDTMHSRPCIASGALTLCTCPPVSSHLYPEDWFLLPSNCGPALVQETKQTSLPSSGLQPQLLQGSLGPGHRGGPFQVCSSLCTLPQP